MLTAVGVLIAFIGILPVILDNQNRSILFLLISGILVLAVGPAMAQKVTILREIRSSMSGFIPPG